jgi:hypothetical protein
MSQCFKKCYDFLNLVSKIKSPRLRKEILYNLRNDPVLYVALHEIAHNKQKGNIPLNADQLKKLRRYEKALVKLSQKELSKKGSKLKRQLIVQSGGWLPILLPALASIIGQVLSNRS